MGPQQQQDCAFLCTRVCDFGLDFRATIQCDNIIIIRVATHCQHRISRYHYRHCYIYSAANYSEFEQGRVSSTIASPFARTTRGPKTNGDYFNRKGRCFQHLLPSQPRYTRQGMAAFSSPSIAVNYCINHRHRGPTQSLVVASLVPMCTAYCYLQPHLIVYRAQLICNLSSSRVLGGVCIELQPHVSITISEKNGATPTAAHASLQLKTTPVPNHFKPVPRQGYRGSEHPYSRPLPTTQQKKGGFS